MRPLLISLLVCLVISCGGSEAVNGPPVSAPLDGVMTPEAAIQLAEGEFAPGERVEAPEPTAGPTSLLNEVAFVSGDGFLPFVEIKLGQDAANLTGLKLRNEDGLEYPLPAAALQGPGPLLLVLFDGGGDAVTPRTVHAASSNFLDPTTGEVSLLASDGTVLDQIAWGDRPDAPSGGQGRVRILIPGDSLTRTPQSTEIGAQHWYYSSETTPGLPNQNPPVGPTFPLPGAAYPPGQIELSWYPSPRARSYRVQVARDPRFADLVTDETVEGPLRVELAEGLYYWRVQMLVEDGTLSNFTRPLALRIQAFSQSKQGRETATRAVTVRKVLPVKPLLQRKDTKLLLLESLGARRQGTATHPWDGPHPEKPDQDFHLDPACNMNCWAAALVMINHYRGSSLSQDRLTYELFKDRLSGLPSPPYRPDDPERDFCYGEGLSPVDMLTRKSITFALGSPPPQYFFPRREILWEVVRTEIAEDRPVLVTFCNNGTSAHDCVIVGWEQSPPLAARGNDPGDDGRALVILNPWYGTEERVFLSQIETYKRVVVHEDSGAALSEIRTLLDLILAPIPTTVNPRNDEPEIEADADNDGVQDFDEVHRFKTDPQRMDSDNDCIHDKDEILSTMFRADVGGPPLPGKDPTFYYNFFYTAFAANPRTFQIEGLATILNLLPAVGRLVFSPAGVFLDKTSRDPDADGLRPERDLNSDRGLLPDFLEDDNRDGFYDKEAGETSPLVDSDDRLHITGTYNLEQSRTTTGPAPPRPITGTTGTVTLDTTRTVEATYDITIQGTQMTGGVTVRESNKSSHYTYDYAGTVEDFEVFVTYEPRTWTTRLLFQEWYCNFSEAPQGQGPTDGLTFQALVAMEEDGSGVPGKVTNLEVPPGTTREGLAAQKVVLPILLDFKNGNYSFLFRQSGPEGVSVESAELKATH